MTGNHIWDRAWKMVVDRSATAEAMFVYAVRTTGDLLPSILPQPPTAARNRSNSIRPVSWRSARDIAPASAALPRRNIRSYVP